LEHFGAWTNHRQTWIHRSHHGSDLREATTFPIIIFSMLGHRACIQMLFCPRIFEIGTPVTLELITSCTNLWLKWGLKQSCSPIQELFNDMWQATYTLINQGDSWLLMLKSQIGNLTPNLSFDHNLCFKYPNGSCESILNI
jgi:hypothetical protein